MTGFETANGPARGSWAAWPLAVAWMAALLILSSKALVSPPVSVAFGDKIAHVGAYGCLGFLLAFARMPIGVDTWRRVALITALVTAFGILTELYQSTLPHRDASAGDVVADALGGFLAAAMVCGYRRRDAGADK